MRYTAGEEDEGKRLSHYVQEKAAPDLSLKAIKQALEENCCRVNGAIERFHSTRIHKGDTVEFSLPPQKKTQILYEDDYLVVIDKPPFVVSDADKGLLGMSLAHRLDKETSGCLLLAKSEKILSDLEELFRERSVKKAYVAIVSPPPKTLSGVIQEPIKGQSAFTSWHKGKSGRLNCWIDCFPETGRTHQIRIHLASKGMPIVGDIKYGTKKAASNRILLHAKSLEFIHPILKKKLLIEAPIPKEFYEALNR